MRTLLYGIFRYAKKKKLVNFSIKTMMDDVEFSKNEFQKVCHEDNEQVFMLDEETKMVKYLEENQDLTLVPENLWFYIIPPYGG